MIENLKYSDDRDKSYGVAGMAVTLVAMDGESLLAAVSLDSAPGQSMQFTPDYYFNGNPRLSARIAYNHILGHLRLTAAMAVGNVICRSYVGRRRAVDSDAVDALRTVVRDEAMDTCSLDADEADALFEKHYSYFDRLFRHQGVVRIASEFADRLHSCRSMSAAEVFECLAELRML